MSDITFRRIKGRIVPIKKPGTPSKGSSGKIDRSKLAQGAALTGAGALTGIYSGKFAAKTVIGAAHFENQARKAGAIASGLISKAAAAGKRAATAATRSPQSTFDFAKKGQFVFRRGGEEAFRAASHASIEGSRIASALFKNRNLIRGFGSAIAGGLIAAGANRIYQAVTKKRPTVAQEVISSAAGSAAALAVGTGYYKTLSVGKGLSKYPQAFRLALKARRIIP